MYHISKAGVWPPIYLPLYLERISAGFPSPAQDYVEQRLDLNKLCVKRPAVHIPEQSGHRFRYYPDSHSAINRTLILR